MSILKAIAEREIRHFLRSLGRSGTIRLGIFVLFFVFLIPSQFEMDESGAIIVIFAIIPTYLAGPSAIDAFAGERDRKTLETLLSSPVSPLQLLWGKLLSLLFLSLSIAWISLLFFLVAFFIKTGFIPDFQAIAVVMIAGILVSFLSSGAGMAISARAKNSKAAQQWFGMTILAFFFAGSFIIRKLIEKLTAETTGHILNLFRNGWFSQGTLLLFLIMLLLCIPAYFYMFRKTKNLWLLNR